MTTVAPTRAIPEGKEDDDKKKMRMSAKLMTSEKLNARGLHNKKGPARAQNEKIVPLPVLSPLNLTPTPTPTLTGALSVQFGNRMSPPVNGLFSLFMI